MEKRPTNRQIREFFNAVARQPALQFEFETGVTGIAGRYEFPKGFTASKYEDYYTWKFYTPIQHPVVVVKYDMPDRARIERDDCPYGIENILVQSSPVYQSALLKGWNRLKQLNPVLSQVVMNDENPAEVYNALLGVTSGFNVNDINFFLGAVRDGHTPGSWAKSIPDMGAMREEIERTTGTGVYWVASRETLQAISRQLASRPPQP